MTPPPDPKISRTEEERRAFLLEHSSEEEDVAGDLDESLEEWLDEQADDDETE